MASSGARFSQTGPETLEMLVVLYLQRRLSREKWKAGGFLLEGSLSTGYSRSMENPFNLAGNSQHELHTALQNTMKTYLTTEMILI